MKIKIKEKIKKKYISRMNDLKIYSFLNYIKQKRNNYLKEKINKVVIIKTIEEIISDEGNSNIELDVKKHILRKNACLNLYKAFNFIFKKYSIEDIKIKQLCRIIEKRGRKIDNSMGSHYKEYIIKILNSLTNSNN